MEDVKRMVYSLSFLPSTHIATFWSDLVFWFSFGIHTLLSFLLMGKADSTPQSWWSDHITQG